MHPPPIQPIQTFLPKNALRGPGETVLGPKMGLDNILNVTF